MRSEEVQRYIDADDAYIERLKASNEIMRTALEEIVQVGGQDLCRGIAAEALRAALPQS